MPFELLEETSPSPNEESMLSTLGRGAARTTARIGEQIAGAPGDIFSLINDYIAKPLAEKITGKPGVNYEETYLGKVLPTTATHRKGLEDKFGELVKPQGKIEKFIDDVISDATAYALPGLKAEKLASKAMKSLAISSIANTVGAGVEDITANESKASMAKLGSLFMLSMFDKPKAAKAIGELYKPLSDKVGQLAPVSANRLSNSLHDLQNKVSKGTLAPSEKFIFDEAGEILSKIKNGRITPEELWSVKRSLNEKLTKVLFDTPQKAAQGRARKLAKHVLRETDAALAQTAKQDPKFYKDLKAADRAFGVIAQSDWISRYFEKNVKYTPFTHGLIEMFSSSLGSTAATAALPYQVGKILYRISKSPVLARHYANTLASAAKDDVIVMNKEFKKLDKELKNEEKKDRFILIE